MSKAFYDKTAARLFQRYYQKSSKPSLGYYYPLFLDEGTKD